MTYELPDSVLLDSKVQDRYHMNLMHSLKAIDLMPLG